MGSTSKQVGREISSQFKEKDIPANDKPQQKIASRPDARRGNRNRYAYPLPKLDRMVFK